MVLRMLKNFMELRTFKVADRWCVHGYYTLCPYAPDGSGRLLVAGADLKAKTAEVIVLSSDGEVLDRFGCVPIITSFWHTGLWQSWSPDAKYVYYQGGSLRAPITIRRELATGDEVAVDADLEGFPPSGEPAFSCSHGLLYAAGYGDDRWKPDEAPVPFLERDRHGLSRVSFEPPKHELVFSTNEILERHPDRERVLEAEKEIRARLGDREGLTLMTYCVRWSPDGSRLLFYFGNHCVVKERQEPKLAYVFTADRDLNDIHLALDLSFGRWGVHWGWQPDNERLIGYADIPGQPGRGGIAEVRYDGADFQLLSEHRSGGHPSVSPANQDLIVTDQGGPNNGCVLFISRKTGEVVERVMLPKFIGEREPSGRNPYRVCHHPVFNQQGDKVLCNTLPDSGLATVVELTPPKDF